MFTQMHSKKLMKLFGERAIAAMIKLFKKLDEGAMPGNPVVIPLNPDEITDSERRQALEVVKLIK